MDARAARARSRNGTVVAVRWFAGIGLAALLCLAAPMTDAVADDYPPSSSPQPTTVDTAPPSGNRNVPRGSIDNPRPVAGRTATVVGQGFESGESVSVAIQSAHVNFGNAVAGTDGTLSLTFEIPSSLRGDRSITLTGLRSGRVASIGVSFIVPPGTVQNDNATSIAVAIVGVGGLGVVLIAGGVSLLVVSRRHALGDTAVAE